MSDPADDDDEGTVHEIDVPFESAGVRLDAHIASRLPLSRSRLKGLIEAGRVRVDGEAQAASKKLRGGEHIIVREPPPQPVELVAEDLPLSILFEDESVLVVDKAAGVAVHPGAGISSGTIANAVRFRCPRVSIAGELRPGIVHRLDKDTSGVLVVAKSDAAQQHLSSQFAARTVEKRYSAYTLGVPPDPFELVTGHRRRDGDRRRFTTKLPAPTTPSPAVRRAHTRGRVVVGAGGAAALDVELLTGRTHQIRAHLSDIGHPLLQDALYGGGEAHKRLPAGPVRDAVATLKRQALHARALAFDHPQHGSRVRFEAALPGDLLRVDGALRSASGAP